MTLDICKNQLLPTALVNKMAKCRQCLAKFVSGARMDQSPTEFLDSFGAARFHKPYRSILLKGWEGRSMRWLPNFANEEALTDNNIWIKMISNEVGFTNLLDENSMPLSFTRAMNFVRNHSTFFKRISSFSSCTLFSSAVTSASEPILKNLLAT